MCRLPSTSVFAPHNMSQDANASKCSAFIKSQLVSVYIENMLSDFKSALLAIWGNYVCKFKCIFFGALSTRPMFTFSLKCVFFGDMSRTFEKEHTIAPHVLMTILYRERILLDICHILILLNNMYHFKHFNVISLFQDAHKSQNFMERILQQHPKD